MGFNPDLTARDNVIINAIMLGLTRKQARERFDEIIAFAELEEFVDLKLKNYSSGMSVRLGFSVAIQVDADVLLVDEVLAVGDAAFQQKCFDEFERMKARGPHDPLRHPRHGRASSASATGRCCSSAARSCDIGAARGDRRALYSELNFGHTAAGAEPAGDGAARAVRVLGAWCEDDDRRADPVARSRAGRAAPASRSSSREASRTRSSRSPSATTCATRSSWPPARSTGRSGAFDAGERVTVRFEFANWLAPSRYTLTPSVVRGRGHPLRSCARTTSPR